MGKSKTFVGLDDSCAVVCLLSGGLDSAVLLYSLCRGLRIKTEQIRALSLFYGQRHSKEVFAARDIAAGIGVDWRCLDLSNFNTLIKGNSQTDSNIAVPHGDYREDTMKQTVVPNRNAVLISIAAAYAISIGFSAVTYAAHAGDHAIYPDCRPQFVENMRQVLSCCHYQPLRLYVPFLNLSKVDIVKLGASMGVPFSQTWTCYEGGRQHCGQCGSCRERQEAFNLAQVEGDVVYDQVH